MIHPLFSLYSLNISFAFISHSYKPYKHLFSALLLDILCFILYSRFIMIVANHILVYKNSTLINSLRVNKFFFTRKEIGKQNFGAVRTVFVVARWAAMAFEKVKRAICTMANCSLYFVIVVLQLLLHISLNHFDCFLNNVALLVPYSEIFSHIP